MKYEEQEVKQTVENDILKVYRKLSIDIFQNKTARNTLFIVFFVLIILELIQTYMFLKKFEGVYFIKYAPLYVGMCYILLCIATIPHSTRVVVDAFKNIPMWRWDCAGNKIEKKIKNEAKIMNTFFIVYAILVTLSAILHVIPDSDDKYMIYPFALFAEFPEWENILGWCFRSTFPVLGLLMITPYSQVIYFCNHIKFQMYLFIYYIKKMDTCFESVDKEKLFYNENYQKEIEKRLLFCIKRHMECYYQAIQVVKKIKNLIILYAVIGTSFVICVLVFFVTFQNMFVGISRYFRMGTFGLATAILSLYVIEVGQGVEDITSEIFESLKELRWYHWNKKIKKLYLIFLLNVEKPFRIQFSEDMSINYDLGTSVGKAVYSMLSVLSQIQDSFQSN